MTSCKKEGCIDPLAQNFNATATKDDGSCTYANATNQSAASPAPILPTYTGEFGLLVAIKTVTTSSTPIGSIDIELGTAVAAFSSDGGATFLPAGTVSVTAASMKTLAAQGNNSYVYTPASTDLTGIDYSSTGITWSGTGGTWPSFTATTTQDFGSIQAISSGDVATNSSYNLTCGGISNADSVYYAVYGPSGSKIVTKAGNTSSHTFSAAELSGLGTGSGFVQITAIKYDGQTIGLKPYYLINETVRTKQVNFN